MSRIYKYSRSDLQTKVIEIKPITTNIAPKPDDSTIDTDIEQEIDRKLASANIAVEEAKAQAANILAKAKSEIKEGKDALEQSRKSMLAEAENKGYQDGLQAGQAEGREQYQQYLKEAQDVLKLAKKDYATILQQSEQTILALALKAASKIVRMKLEEEPDYFIEIVKGVLKEVRDQDNISVYAHPNDYPLLLNQKEELQTILRTQADLMMYPDGDLPIGSCIVESSFGRIDASIDSQLIEIRTKLFEHANELSQEESREP
ncbi:flagellar assembly protein FliH [Aquibacillus sp. 3ASR75-11]|uniref:Flagellar assembly protein FliH n=1 Tax=Terrihalobacillus insolitus TaxID=2950438 RepID=A0A9X4ALA5_9BACI|nr:flagellar assembly protein FliH [Terrihalobacillus insolitus]MDC3414138.1 flagellar assembly protein FliH [Terrihalobacillus insolitus]MDC3423579.1 flagellar assembly protein FliH [Terrihalobacillus insolitus]